MSEKSNNKFIIRVVAILLGISILIGSFVAGFFYSTYVHGKTKNAKNFDTRLLNEVVGNIKATFYDDVSDKKLLDGAIDGIIESLGNPYASYYSPNEYKHFKTSMSGHYSGIGVVIGGKRGRIEVVKVFEESPALGKGLKKGDLIIKVDSRLTKNLDLDQAAELIKGPEGTTVKLTVKSKEKTRVVKIKRKKIDFPNISSRTYGSIGYINMHFFNSGTAQLLEETIIKLQKKGAKSLILDLRSNPGGQLNEAVDVVSLFIDKGVVVRTRDKDKEETTYSAGGGRSFDGKLVILIGENSASASEIVAGAIQDRGRGTVVGLRSFGKGTVQQIVPIENGGALVIPSEKWITPKGRDITKKGIKPDIEIKTGSNGDDKQLEKAKSLLK